MRVHPILFPLLALPLLFGPWGCQDQLREDAFWPQPGEGATPKVLLVGWDGIRVDVLEEVATPVLDTLAAVGAFSAEAATARPTVSGPCWSSILIGAWAEKHGVHSNDFSSNNYGEYPDLFTRLEEVRPGLNTFAAVDWLPLGTETDGGPLIGDAIDELFVADGYEHGWLEADSMGVEAAIRQLENGDPDALFVYLGAPDEISHTIGGIGEEYREAIRIADAHTGRLVEAIKARPTYAEEDWLVLVVTDHGRTDGGGHGGTSPEETNVFYLASGPSVIPGTPSPAPATVDAPVTAMAHLGVKPDASWALDGRVVGIPLPPDTLRILAYNTHHGEGMDGELDLERIAEVIRSVDPDVVTLQEIDRVVERTGGVDQAAVYGELAGMDAIFGDFMAYQGGHYGMALLSRLPVEESMNLRLPDGAEPRSAVTARVRLPGWGREVVVSGIHFYRTEEERLAQARSLLEQLGLAEPADAVILAGDFNSQPGTPVMEYLAGFFTVPEKDGTPFTFPADGPEREIDFILVQSDSGFDVLEYRVLGEEVASDHRPVFMVLELR